MIAQVKWKGHEKLACLDQYRALFPKRYKTQPQLKWKKNRNSYAIYQMVPFSMTLNDLGSHIGNKHNVLNRVRIARIYGNNATVVVRTNIHTHQS